MISGRRYLATFVVGFFCCADMLCHPIFEPVVEFSFITEFSFFATILAMVAIIVVGLPIRWIPAVRFWWKSRAWPGAAIIGLALTLYWISWWPSLRITVHDPSFPDIPSAHVDSYNRPLGIASWFLLLFGIMHYVRPEDRIVDSAPRESLVAFDKT